MYYRFLVFIIIIMIPVIGCSKQAQEKQAPVTLNSEMDSLSYCIGMDIATNMKKQEIAITVASLLKGFEDAYNNQPTMIPAENSKDIIMAFQQKMSKVRAEKAQAEGEKNLQTGEAFLKENGAKPGVVTLPSGLQYKVVVDGKGKKPKLDDTVVVNYKGTLIDGKEFDSSYKRGEPASFQVSKVIKGWTEAIQLMSVGSKWELYIPADLAYGPRGAGQDIGPNSTLIFEVELLEIK